MSSIRENRLFLGNPGTGKSTLINCLVGNAQFKSGLSWGGGLTQYYQRFEKDDIAYMDAPGLADETIQLQAAQAITKALKQSGKYKLFFMVRLQNGRVVGEDLVTLERVLDSIEAGDLNYKFTIVINCVGERQYESLMERGDEFKMIKTLINRRYLTESFCFVPRIEALEEKSNTIVELPQEVRDFLEKDAPVITVEERQVRPIAVAGFAQQSQEIKSEIEKLRNDQAALLRTMKEQEKRHGEAMKRMRESHAGELDRMSRGVSVDAAKAYPEAVLLSPKGDCDYRAFPLSPPAVSPSTGVAARFSHRKRLVAVIIALIIVTAIIVGIILGTQTKHAEPTPTPAPARASTPTSAPTTEAPMPTPAPLPTLEVTPAPIRTSTLTQARRRWRDVGCVSFTKPLSGQKNKTLTSPSNQHEEEGSRFAAANDRQYFAFSTSNRVVAFDMSNTPNTITCPARLVDPIWYVYEVVSV